MFVTVVSQSSSSICQLSCLFSDSFAVVLFCDWSFIVLFSDSFAVVLFCDWSFVVLLCDLSAVELLYDWSVILAVL